MYKFKVCRLQDPQKPTPTFLNYLARLVSGSISNPVVSIYNITLNTTGSTF